MSPSDENRRRARDAIAGLRDLNLDRLRHEWAGRFGAPPKIRSADVLRRLLAERIQIELFGLNPALQKELDRLVRTYQRGGPLTEPKASVRDGSVLIREWGGTIHRVEVANSEFRWNGRTYRSLSVIAREITGTRWNGPRFFGLREEKPL